MKKRRRNAACSRKLIRACRDAASSDAVRPVSMLCGSPGRDPVSIDAARSLSPILCVGLGMMRLG
jgi:hypothetical protein